MDRCDFCQTSSKEIPLQFGLSEADFGRVLYYKPEMLYEFFCSQNRSQKIIEIRVSIIFKLDALQVLWGQIEYFNWPLKAFKGH